MKTAALLRRVMIISYIRKVSSLLAFEPELNMEFPQQPSLETLFDIVKVLKRDVRDLLVPVKS